MSISATIVGWNPTTRTWSVQRDEPGTVALPEQLVGMVDASDEQLRWAAEDWGHLVHHRPRAVCRPRTAEQVAVLLAWASEQHLTVAARGGGHSGGGQAQAAGGVVLDMELLAAVEDVSSDRITVQAGTQWTTVLREAVARRRTPPVLTDYLSTSVGGTLSSGGVGGASHHWGFQVDQVLAVEVATPQGVVLWCTPHRNSEVFDAVRCGHGQVGVITRAVLSLAPAPDQVCWRRLYYDELETYLADHRRVVTEQRFDYLEGQAQPTDDGDWGFMMEAVSYGSEADEDTLTADLQHDRLRSTQEWLPYVDFADRMGPAEAVERATGAWLWPHPWANAFVPDSQIEQVSRETLKQLSPAEVGVGGVVLMYPLRTTPCRAPLLRLPDEDVVWLVALLRKAPPDDPATVQDWMAGNDAFLQRVLAAGGHSYPINQAPLSTTDWQRHYGQQWPSLTRAKDEHDPHRILTPGQGMFTR